MQFDWQVERKRDFEESMPSLQFSPKEHRCDEDESDEEEKGFIERLLKKREEINEESFVCGIDGCEEVFYSEKDYENHYESRHHFKCRKCERILLSEHLLTMHVLEEHDTLFKLMSQRQPMYNCYVQTCLQKFATKEERNQHAIQTHLFPPNSKIFDNGILENQNQTLSVEVCKN